MKFIKLTKKDYPKIREDTLINLEKVAYFEKCETGNDRMFSIHFNISDKTYHSVDFFSKDDRDLAFYNICEASL